MRGIVGLLPGGQVALRIAAVGRSDRQIVIVADMAERARHIGMAIGEQKPGRTVIELCIQPIVERMASFAGRGELCGEVVRICRFLKVRQVARLARRRKSQVISDRCIFVALLALDYGVRPEQRKPIEVLLD